MDQSPLRTADDFTVGWLLQEEQCGHLSGDTMVVINWNHPVWLDIKVCTHPANLAAPLYFLISHRIPYYAENYIHMVLCYVVPPTPPASTPL